LEHPAVLAALVAEDAKFRSVVILINNHSLDS